ncbi:MAG: proton-conducting transporter membrane subunit, partial [Actinomycetota bacterium]|nr:proton-conducting transporter membrane subunit [Actinomycetota bacterium]
MNPIMPGDISTLTFALDPTAAPVFALFAVRWAVSGIYAAVTTPAGQRARLFAYFIPSAVGGITVALAADAISFYLCFALMAIPAWGLITHARTAEARRAGAIYLTLTAIGEALLLAALIIMVVETGSLELSVMAEGIGGSPLRDVAAALALASIALKIGTLPVSGILPLSYTYTPAGAASALAGAPAKVGALAMIRLLPAGSMPESWAAAVMVLGLATAFGAAVLGTLTTAPRSVLGYSSASQMGLVLIAAGVSLAEPAAVPLAHGAIVAFAIHHGLAKSALVLGDDVVSRLTGRARTSALAALALPALALVG